MGYTRCLSLPTILGYVLVTYVYYTVIVLVIQPWMGILTANGLFNALSYTLWYGMVLWSYSICIFKDPGGVPAKYIPDMEDSTIEHDEVGSLDRKAGGGGGGGGGGKETRFCQKCGCHKPPRSHHCRVCKRCVLRMDHHCIWINNCVGHRNYKAFVLFVLYDVLALLHGLALVLTHALSCVSSSSSLSPAQCGFAPPLEVVTPGGSPAYTWLHPSPGASAFLRVAYVLICLPMAGSLLVLLLWQLYLIALNRTTIEMASSQRHRRACRKCKSDEEGEEGESRVAMVEGVDGLKPRHDKGGHSHSHGGHSHGRGVMGWLSRMGLTSLSRRSLIAMFFSHYASLREQLLDPKSNGLNFHPYDLGIAENLHVIMGPNPLLWFCPIATGHLHSGLRFPKSQDYGKSHMDRGL